MPLDDLLPERNAVSTFWQIANVLEDQSLGSISRTRLNSSTHEYEMVYDVGRLRVGIY